MYQAADIATNYREATDGSSRPASSLDPTFTRYFQNMFAEIDELLMAEIETEKHSRINSIQAFRGNNG